MKIIGVFLAVWLWCLPIVILSTPTAPPVIEEVTKVSDGSYLMKIDGEYHRAFNNSQLAAFSQDQRSAIYYENKYRACLRREIKKDEAE